MKLKATEHNYNRLANKYHLDVYEHNNEYTVFNEQTGDMISHLPDMKSVIRETVTLYNETMEERRRLNKKNNQNEHADRIVA